MSNQIDQLKHHRNTDDDCNTLQWSVQSANNQNASQQNETIYTHYSAVLNAHEVNISPNSV